MKAKLGFALVLLACWISGARAALPEVDLPLPRGGVLEADRAQPAPAWRDFLETNHDWWIADWDRHHPAPHRALGGGLRLGEGPVLDAGDLDRRIRDFLRAHRGLMPVEEHELEALHLGLHGGVWYARYRQSSNGRPVLLSETEFRVGSGGGLMMMGSDAHAGIPRLESRLDRGSVRARVDELASGEPGTGRCEVGDWVVLPILAGKGFRFETAWPCRVDPADPELDSQVFLSGETGEILWSWNRVRHVEISGAVECWAEPQAPDDMQELFPLDHAWITVDGEPVTLDDAGSFTVDLEGEGPWDLEGGFAGLYADVNRQDGADNEFAFSLEEDGQVFEITDADGTLIEERDAYVHTNLVHDFIRGMDPSFTGLDWSLPVNINIDQTCNAFWNGSSINFFREGDGCPNTARVAGVVYHEYGHGINDLQYVQAGSPFGMINGALHEGLADVTAVYIQDVNYVSPGWFIRDLDNSNSYPEDIIGEVHYDGLIIGGAMWDLRETLGLEIVRPLHHFARWGTPDDVDTGRAFFDYFIELLVADDDNGDLGDLTPHFAEIDSTFNLHGIGTDLLWLGANFALLDLELLATPDEELQLAASLDVPPLLTVEGIEVLYSIDGGDDQAMLLEDEGEGVWTGAIPAQPEGTVVEYYARVLNPEGFVIQDPADAPDQRYRSYFLVLSGQTLDFELDDGGAEAEGSWEWGAPQSGPGGAHSGVNLWATNLDGNYPDNVWDMLDFPPQVVGNNGVAVLRFWHWMSIEAGWDGAAVDISINGGEFELIAPLGGYDFVTPDNNTRPGTPAWCGFRDWEQASFDLSEWVLPGDEVVFRLSLFSDGYVTDAGWYVDDVEFLGFLGATDIVHIPLGDTEDVETAEFPVEALLTGGAAIDSFLCRWRIDEGEIQTLQMEETGEPDAYQAFIPGPFDEQSISYRLEAFGPEYYMSHPAEEDAWHGFYVGVDVEPPQAWFTLEPRDIIGHSGVVRAEGRALDNIGVAELGVQYRPAGGEWSATAPMDTLAGEILWAEFYIHVESDLVEFRLRAVDSGSQSNEGYSDVSQITAGQYQFVDNFPSSTLVDWTVDGGWGATDFIAYEGAYSLAAGGPAGIPFWADWTAAWDRPIDLEYADGASLDFYEIYSLEEGDDLVMLEVSADGENWTVHHTATGENDWSHVQADLSDYLGQPEVYFRFHLTADGDNDAASLGYAVDLITLVNAGVAVETAVVPPGFSLSDNYPNPFNPSTTIEFSLPEPARASLKVYNLRGQLLETLVDGPQAAGRYRLRYDASRLASGVYIYSLETPWGRETGKMVLLK